MIVYMPLSVIIRIPFYILRMLFKLKTSESENQTISYPKIEYTGPHFDMF